MGTPKDLVTARSVQPYNELDPSKKDWLAVASLGANLSAAAGVGGKGNFSLSLQNGQIILRLKAALIAGVGADGDFSFVLGYKALVYFLDIFNRELIKNEYHKLDWIMPEAFEYFTKAQVLHAVGVDLQWVFLLGYNTVNALYDAMTAGDRAGVMALQIAATHKKVEIQKWYATLTPEGLGSLLDTLIQAPASMVNLAAVAIDGVVTQTFNTEEMHYLQQRAIAVVLGAIVKHGGTSSLASAQRKFEEAVIRLGGFEKPFSDMPCYRNNVERLDKFMSAVLSIDSGESLVVRERYVNYRNLLGADADKKFSAYCSFDVVSFLSSKNKGLGLL